MSRCLTLTVTCERCGYKESFEITNVPLEGPIIATTKCPTEILQQRGWSVAIVTLRCVDVCGPCNTAN